MAAAAFSSSRAVAGVTTTKGLFFIFSLLCLVCLASSWVDKDQLEMIKEMQKESNKLREDFKSKNSLPDLVSSMQQIKALMKKYTQAFFPDFPPLDKYMKNLDKFMEKTKAYYESRP